MRIEGFSGKSFNTEDAESTEYTEKRLIAESFSA